LVSGLSFPQGSRAGGASRAGDSPSLQENLSRPRGTSRLTVFLLRWAVAGRENLNVQRRMIEKE